jgi:hypothetical protein
MICPTKPIKNQTPKTASIDQAVVLNQRDAKADSVAWSPFTAGPYLVPVTRWIE